MRPHGTRARYVTDECRCDECRRANADYYHQRRRRRIPTLIDSSAAREHIAWLSSQGVGYKQVAKVSGVSLSVIARLANIDHTRPAKRIRPGTAEKILAVTPADAADGAYVPAGRTWRQYDELRSAGMPRRRIAERCGGTDSNMSPGSKRVTRRFARLIAEVHAEYLAGELVYQRHSRHGTRTVHVPSPRDMSDEARRYNLRLKRAKYDDRRGKVYLDDGDLFVDRLADTIRATTDRGWVRRAACRDHPTWMWFPDSRDVETIAAAKAICDYCPVRSECLTAHGAELIGIYGGLTPEERTRTAA